MLRKILKMIIRPLLYVSALLLLVEEWLWSHLKSVVAEIVRRIPLDEFKALLARWIDRLPPYATFLVFLGPALMLLPLKIFGVWCLGKGFWILGVLNLVAAKILGMAVTAFIFDLTKPKLLQIPWFNQSYLWITKWLGWAHQVLQPVKERIHYWKSRVRVMIRKLFD